MKDYSEIIDVSLPLHTHMVVYPNNPVFEVEPIESTTSFISRLALGTHTGTHVDAPAHAEKGAAGVDELPLEAFVGPCRVLDMTQVEEGISVADLEAAEIGEGERILVKTRNSSRGYDEFYENFIYLDGDAAEYLASKDIRLFGTDYLSIKKKGSMDNRPHTALLSKMIPIVEGLDLSKVEPGKYTFVALPLKLVDLDGSPVRAILMR
jgi:arylformamidase